MSVLVLLVVIPLVILFAILSIAPDLIQESDEIALVQKQDGRTG